MQRKLERIILDLKDLTEERYINEDAREELVAIIKRLEYLHIFSTEIK